MLQSSDVVPALHMALAAMIFNAPLLSTQAWIRVVSPPCAERRRVPPPAASAQPAKIVLSARVLVK